MSITKTPVISKTPSEKEDEVLRKDKDLATSVEPSSENHLFRAPLNKDGMPVFPSFVPATISLTTKDGKIVKISEDDPQIFPTIIVENFHRRHDVVQLRAHIARSGTVYFYVCPDQGLGFVNLSESILKSIDEIKEFIVRVTQGNGSLRILRHDDITKYIPILSKYGIELEETA